MPDQTSQRVKIFHGTDKEFENFDLEKSADGTIWFTTNRQMIEDGQVAASGKGRIIERSIDESKLKLGGWKETDRYSTDELIAMGYDGLKLPGDNETTYQIFFPEKLQAPIKGQAMPDAVDLDSEYFAAVEKNDWSTAQKIVNQAKGIVKTDHSFFRGDSIHSPSGPDNGAPGYDLSDGAYPADIYSSQGLRYYATGSDLDFKAYEVVTRMKGRPNQQIRVFRAVEKNGPKKIQAGDWVTTVRDYAKEHGKANIAGPFKIISELVTAKDIYTSGDSWLEWGYHPQEQRNWPKAILRDESGNVIAPSKRFSQPSGTT